MAIQLNKLDNISVNSFCGIKRSQNELSLIQPIEGGYHRGIAFGVGSSNFIYCRSGVWQHMGDQQNRHYLTIVTFTYEDGTTTIGFGCSFQVIFTGNSRYFEYIFM